LTGGRRGLSGASRWRIGEGGRWGRGTEGRRGAEAEGASEPRLAEAPWGY